MINSDAKINDNHVYKDINYVHNKLSWVNNDNYANCQAILPIMIITIISNSNDRWGRIESSQSGH